MCGHQGKIVMTARSREEAQWLVLLNVLQADRHDPGSSWLFVEVFQREGLNVVLEAAAGHSSAVKPPWAPRS